MATGLTAEQKTKLVELMTAFYESGSEDKLNEVFDIFDIDHNKKIDAVELKIVMAEITGAPVTEEQVQDMINEADTDKDGTINLQEFINVMKLHRSG
jgi:Ca2+-binding EF-hand superfamily protein